MPGQPLLLPNPWDVGSARLLASLGFEALATTKQRFCRDAGRLDGSVTRPQALDHAAAIVSATELPVSADLENGFCRIPGGRRRNGRGAVRAGLAGFSIEDFSGSQEKPIYELARAAELVGARLKSRTVEPLTSWSRSLGELSARPARARRHDRTSAGLQESRSRCPLRAGTHERRGDPRDRGRRSIGPSTCSFRPGAPSVAELASSASAGSRSVARSRSSRCRPSSRPRVSCASRARMGFGTQAGDGARAARPRRSADRSK